MSEFSRADAPIVTDNMSLYKASAASAFSWLKRLDGLGLFVFVCSTMFLRGYGEQRILAIIMITLFILVNSIAIASTLKRIFPAPPEILCYTAWVAWAGLTGVFVADNQIFFWEAYKVLLQMVVMVWIIYAILCNLPTVDVVFLAVIVGGIVQITTILSGITSAHSLMYSVDRVSGLTNNPNSLGFMMVWTILCALFFWHNFQHNKKFGRFLILGMLPAAIYVILASGSRKSAIALLLLIFSWISFYKMGSYRMGSYLKRAFMIGFIFLILLILTPLIMNYTPVGFRFANFLKQGQGNVVYSIQQQGRYLMYVDGIKFFLENPIFGVGLNNFKVHFFAGKYSHSDYIEPLATTGLLGFILYQSFYIIIIKRTIVLMRTISNQRILYKLKMIIIGVSIIMVLGFGAPHHTSQSVFILLTAFSGYTSGLKREILSQKFNPMNT